MKGDLFQLGRGLRTPWMCEMLWFGMGSYGVKCYGVKYGVKCDVEECYGVKCYGLLWKSGKLQSLENGGRERVQLRVQLSYVN